LYDLDRDVLAREKTLFLGNIKIERADGARGRGDLAKRSVVVSHRTEEHVPTNATSTMKIRKTIG
jgi:hypothetical protein